jgi:hypothetical protein
MVTKSCFIAKDYLRAFDLKNLFHKYVVLYTQLNYSDNADPLQSKDRHELTLKLQETMNEISLLVLRMKESKSDIDELNKADINSINSSKSYNDSRIAN